MSTEAWRWYESHEIPMNHLMLQRFRIFRAFCLCRLRFVLVCLAEFLVLPLSLKENPHEQYAGKSQKNRHLTDRCR